MPGPVHILRAASVKRRISLLRIYTSSPAYSRAFHASQTALKKKGKAVENDTLFDDDGGSDTDELFSASTPDSKSQTAPTMPSKLEPLPRRRVSPSSETGLPDEKTAEELRLKEERRREAFQGSYEYLYERTGDAGKQTSALPARRALHTLVKLAISQEEWQRVIGTFRQWRRYPARPVPSSIQRLFIERATSTGHAPLVVNILTHHPIYGIHIDSLQFARALLKNLIAPVNSPLPSEVDPSTHRERLDQALRLSQVFSISTIPVAPLPEEPSGPSEPISEATQTEAEAPPRKPITLSPSNDLILGSLLLSALLRVASHPPTKPATKTKSGEPSAAPVTAGPAAVAHAAHDLLVSLRALPSYIESTMQSQNATLQEGVLSGKEKLWCIAALTECMVLLRVKRVRQLFDGIHEEGGTVDGSDGEKVERMSVDQMISWLEKARGWLMQGASEQGAAIRRKMEAVLVKDVPAEERDQKKGGNDAVGNHLVGRGDGLMEEARG